MQIIPPLFAIFYSKRVVFLSQIADGDGQEGDRHLAGRRIPAEYLDAQFEAEIVDGQVERHDADIAHKLPRTVQVRAGERDVFIEPETRQQGDRKDDTERRYMRRDCLRKLKTEN